MNPSVYADLSGNKYCNDIKSQEVFMAGDGQNIRELRHEDIKVILKFPEKSEEDELIKAEVKEIMISALREQLHKQS